MPTLAGDADGAHGSASSISPQRYAAVIATDRYAAADGVAAVDVDYEAAASGDRPLQSARAGRNARAAGP